MNVAAPAADGERPTPAATLGHPRGRCRGPVDRLPGGLAGGLAAVLPAALLIASMLAFRWYGRAGADGPIAPRIPRDGPVSGWSALPGLHALTVAVFVLALVLLGAGVRAPGSLAGRVLGGLLAVVSALVTVVLVVRVLIALPGGGVLADAKLGAAVGLGAALATFLAALGAAIAPQPPETAVC